MAVESIMREFARREDWVNRFNAYWKVHCLDPDQANRKHIFVEVKDWYNEGWNAEQAAHKQLYREHLIDY